MNTDHLFITRDEIKKLVALLREIPEIIEELSITLTRQDCLGKGGAKVSMGEREQPLPFDVNASEVSDDLHNTILGWVRHVCESRGLDYTGATSTIGLARWLDRNVIALAMTEGSGEAMGEIQYAMRRARWATDRPARDDTVHVVDVAQARNSELNAMAIERMRCELGDEYSGLTARRIKTLRNKTNLEPVRVVASVDGDLAVYRLGDVLDAHLAYPARQRKISA